ncbi:MAG: PLP-dependent aspartate aminotransferase family protein [Chloroflexota bacterium]
MKPETLAIHTGQRPDPLTGAVSVPIYQTSTFAFAEPGKTRGWDYSRSGNPTRRVLEDTIAALEGGKAGFACSTGMSAITTVVALLAHGDHIVCGDDVYGGTYRLFQNVISRFGIEVTFTRMNSKETIERAIRPNTKLIWIETPSNPLLGITDIEMVAGLARSRKILTAIDNTFATPIFLQPARYGIDIIVHSTTKYLNGHCDVVGGAIVTTTDELTNQIGFLHNAMGTCASPFDCWLVLRGIETLAVRVRKHESNALAVASFLKSHPAVRKVYYPGLPGHPGHDVARKQMKGFGGVVSYEIGGGTEAVNQVMGRTKLFTLAESLGGAVSLIEHPATMSHASMPPEYRQSVGITDGLIRLSVGLEDSDDLIADLDQALKD